MKYVQFKYSYYFIQNRLYPILLPYFSLKYEIYARNKKKHAFKKISETPCDFQDKKKNGNCITLAI